MKNFKTFYEKRDERLWHDVVEKETKERRNKKFRDWKICFLEDQEMDRITTFSKLK
jgi:hypothetical protein